MNNKISYLRSILTWIVAVLGVIILGGGGVLLFSWWDKTGVWGHRTARLWGWCITKASGVAVKISGLDYLSDTAGPYVIMSNHQGNFDIWILLAYLPIEFRLVAKEELFRIPVLAATMRGAGYISLDRSHRSEALRKLAAQAQDRLSKGYSVVVFPEGTRTGDGKVGNFNRGAFFLSSHAQVPILPITIDGSWKVMSRRTVWVSPGVVRLIIHPPISVQETGKKGGRRDLADQVRNVIMSPLAI